MSGEGPVSGETAPVTALAGLRPALQRLDRLLARAVVAAREAFGAASVTDRFRGLYIGDDEVGRLLAREPGDPILRGSGEDADDTSPGNAAIHDSRLGWLARAFNLSSFDVDLILIALAPEIDLRYERLYAYLQDDVTRKLPTVDLALNLLCASADIKLARRSRITGDGALIREGLVRLVPDPHHVQPPLLSHYLKLDEQITGFLLSAGTPDSRLASFCHLVEPTQSLDDAPVAAPVGDEIRNMGIQARSRQESLRLYFEGPSPANNRRTAEALAGDLGMPLLLVDITRGLTAPTAFDDLSRLIFREAWFRDAVLYLDGLDAVRSALRGAEYDRLVDELNASGGITILSGALPWVPPRRGPTSVLSMRIATPNLGDRRTAWDVSLSAHGFAADAQYLDVLASRFRLDPDQIANAVSVAATQALGRASADSASAGPPLGESQLTLDDLIMAARTQSGHELAALAQKIEPVYHWPDLILPDDVLQQIGEIRQRVAHRTRVMDDWGFGRKLSMGRGTTVLFAGPSGTGKTMAAEVIANELHLDLYKIDLSAVVSKWIGETEKNLDRIFGAAENANAILLFDEADALFGKRSEIRDSHDRYANIDISYLLQKMEQYDGIAVLATNLLQHLDESFLRRLAFTVHFPLPAETERRRIWHSVWPPATPRSADVDLDLLSKELKLTGGNIKNIALAASFFAAGDGGHVMMAHLILATQRELQKMGTVLSGAELSRLRCARASPS